MSKTRLAGKCGQIRTGTQADLRFRRLPVRPQNGSCLTDTGPVAKSSGKDFSNIVATGLSGPTVMSLIGLLTATEKQVHLGRHLKNNWRVPESLEKVIPIPRSLHPHLQWWLQGDNVLVGQPLHPIRHALQIFTDASKEG